MDCERDHSLDVPRKENIELDVEMASLEINERKRRFSALSVPSEEDNETCDMDCTKKTLRRSARKVFRPLALETKKKMSFDGASDKSSLRGKMKHTSLETIFEEPKSENVVMSGRKFRRLISFKDHLSQKMKTKKRYMKAKKITKNVLRSSKVSKDLLLEKLREIDDSPNT